MVPYKDLVITLAKLVIFALRRCSLYITLEVGKKYDEGEDRV